ncbi:uncharacterized protein LOC114132404 [Rhizophagus clarus]|uniref:Uncharacterized protein LOC114132404 n=1 Tax=Rhizophagus clarus TaxID=94130 RepID=A0A8H3LYT0_9GLOM|nr:uncharacterized protein LOC114132404 [Rhizophagus clarus]
MRSEYELPSSKLLSDRLLNQEIAKINDNINDIIKNSENLTLTLDEWTNPNGNHYIGEFLADQITNIIKEIGPKRVFTLVTDNAANCVKARKIITNQFLKIIDL